MSVLRCGSPSGWRRMGSFLVVIGCAFAMAGCASQKAARHSSAAPNPGVVARADTEADGQPAQTPPPIAIRALPDDPREPWSRNYGSVRPGSASGMPATPISTRPPPPPIVPLPTRPAAPPPAPRPPAAAPPRAASADVDPRPTSPPVSSSGIRVEIPADLRRKMAEVGVR